MKIYLVGYMGAGKSTLGKKLAEAMELDFIDLDEAFESKFHVSISSFFEKYGEEAFRKLEQQLLHETGNLTHCVISTGGGTPCYGDNMNWMCSSGVTLYLEVPEEELAKRLKASHKKRPLLAANDDDFEDALGDHLRKRALYYSDAQIIIRGDNPDMEELKNEIYSTMLRRPAPPAAE